MQSTLQQSRCSSTNHVDGVAMQVRETTWIATIPQEQEEAMQRFMLTLHVREQLTGI